MIKQRVEVNRLPTGLALIDRKLLGGIPARSVTEVVGAPGVGKTQFSMMLAVLALRQAASRAAARRRAPPRPPATNRSATYSCRASLCRAPAR